MYRYGVHDLCQLRSKAALKEQQRAAKMRRAAEVEFGSRSRVARTNPGAMARSIPARDCSRAAVGGLLALRTRCSPSTSHGSALLR
jgi:hypothetical protein